jgi:hypothetical protein
MVVEIKSTRQIFLAWNEHPKGTEFEKFALQKWVLLESLKKELQERIDELCLLKDAQPISIGATTILEMQERIFELQRVLSLLEKKEAK